MSRSDPYPLSVTDHRELSGYAGPVFIWDIDKTYLSTHFSSMRGLARIPVEAAVDKEAIPGMPDVLRGLRRGPGPGVACSPVYFVSASPPQLRQVIERKMMLDGVEHDGITFKDWLGAFARLTPSRLFEQVGFKLCALLEGRKRRPLAVEYLFGDDFEKDAEAYNLYVRLIDAGTSREEAGELMEAEGVDERDRLCALGLLEDVPERNGGVGRAFIHLERGSSPGIFERFGELVVPVKGGYQLGLALFGMGLVDRETVSRAARAVSKSFPGTPLTEASSPRRNCADSHWGIRCRAG